MPRNKVRGFPVKTILSLLILLVNLQGEYFQEIVNISADSSGYVVLVDKSSQLLFVAQADSSGKVNLLQTYRITTGQAVGNKEKEGDLKTPEGIYFVTGYIPGEKLPPRYGPLALVLNYPNLVDRIFNHTGSNIWIHGRDEDIQDRQTKGCISLENHQVLTLKNYIQFRKTPIIIVDTLKSIDSLDFELQRTIWLTFLKKWKNDWENGNTDDFLAFYAPKYYDRQGDFSSFAARKRYFDKKYNWKIIEIDDILVFQSDFEIHIRFNQSYLCPYFYTRGSKVLTLCYFSDYPLIVNETFTPTMPEIKIPEKIEEFIQDWIAAWSARDLEKYAQFYHGLFQSQGYNKVTWLEHKANIFRHSENIQISYSNLSIKSEEPRVWTVSFIQEYRSSILRDKGIKTLKIRGFPDNFQIISEEWQAIR